MTLFLKNLIFYFFFLIVVEHGPLGTIPPHAAHMNALQYFRAVVLLPFRTVFVIFFYIGRNQDENFVWEGIFEVRAWDLSQLRECYAQCMSWQPWLAYACSLCSIYTLVLTYLYCRRVNLPCLSSHWVTQTFFRCRRAVLTGLFVVYNLLFYVTAACRQIWDLGYILGCGSTGISQKSQSLSVWDAPKHRHPRTFAVWKGMNTACTVHLKHARFTEDHNQHVLPAGGALGNYRGMICTSGTS